MNFRVENLKKLYCMHNDFLNYDQIFVYLFVMKYTKPSSWLHDTFFIYVKISENSALFSFEKFSKKSNKDESSIQTWKITPNLNQTPLVYKIGTNLTFGLSDVQLKSSNLSITTLMWRTCDSYFSVSKIKNNSVLCVVTPPSTDCH